ncbi:MAG TPA: GntR family transcriptional regulator [Pedobacter sp.]
MKSLSRIWKEIFKRDFISEKNKGKALADQIIKLIESSKLAKNEKLPSIADFVQETGLSKSTVSQVLRILTINNYLISRPGKGYYVNSLSANAQPQNTSSSPEEAADGLSIHADQYCLSAGPLTAQGYIYKAFEAHNQKFERNVKPSGQNRMVPELISTLSRRLSHLHGKVYEEANLYYSHAFGSIIRTVAKVITGNKGGVMVVPQNSCLEVRTAFASVNIQLVEIKTDENGFCVEELEAICTTYQVKGVYLMSNANFPDTIHTIKSRLELLVWLQRKYHFTIIEDDKFATWLAPKGNWLLDLADIQQDDIIYLRPVSLVHEQLCRLTIIAATKHRMAQIIQQAVNDGEQAYQAVAHAINEILKDGTDVKAMKRMSAEIAKVTQVATETLLETGLWKEQGIVLDAGMGFYLVPKQGRFPNDIFKTLKAQNINIVDPKQYLAGSAIPGLRLSLGSYVGNKKLKPDLIRLSWFLKERLLTD